MSELNKNGVFSIGVVLFGFGAGTAFGWTGALIAVGLIMMLAAIYKGMSSKIAELKPAPVEDDDED